MNSNLWCAIENAWTDHDTAHHGDPTGFAVSDRVQITDGEWEGRSGLVQQVRNPNEYVVRIPGKGNTLTVTVPRNQLKRIA